MKRGISPSISYVLILALVITISLGAFIWGNAELNRLQDIPIASNMESQLITIDQIIQSVSHGDTNFTVTQQLFFPKGIIQIEDNNDWVKFTAQLNANIYEVPITGGINTTCDSGTIRIQDSVTTVKMNRIQHTNVFRGATGDEVTQFVQIVACYDTIDITTDQNCAGRSGPRAIFSARKIGYNASAGKSTVEVKIC